MIRFDFAPRFLCDCSLCLRAREPFDYVFSVSHWSLSRLLFSWGKWITLGVSYCKAHLAHRGTRAPFVAFDYRSIESSFLPCNNYEERNSSMYKFSHELSYKAGLLDTAMSHPTSSQAHFDSNQQTSLLTEDSYRHK